MDEDQQLRFLIQRNVKSLEKRAKRYKLKKIGCSSCSDNSDQFFDNLISVEELAVFFGLAPQTIRNWVARRKIPYIQIGRRNVFQKRSVQEWLNKKEKSQWR